MGLYCPGGALPLERGELIPCFASFVRAASALPIKLFLSKSTRFLTLSLLILSPIPVVGSDQVEWLHGAYLLPGIEPQHVASMIWGKIRPLGW